MRLACGEKKDVSQCSVRPSNDRKGCVWLGEGAMLVCDAAARINTPCLCVFAAYFLSLQPCAGLCTLLAEISFSPRLGIRSVVRGGGGGTGDVFCC